jgi:hypothetical protein|tara:strand:- start:57 stop:455 length:399 start_codon:yes stop_codon:yes gene_type:complete
MSQEDCDRTCFLKEFSFAKQRSLLIYWYYFIDNNELWDYLFELQFKKDNQERSLWENIEYLTEVEFVNCGKTFKILLQEAKKHNLSDLNLLHILLFLKYAGKHKFSIEDFPLLVEKKDMIINPLIPVYNKFD